jgi:pimeloyl-ACP methyl ester carboxylesterase
MPLIESTTSKDGTAIAFEGLGHGPPLVMVHGSTVDHTRWGAVVANLAKHFSLYLVDRRGRGKSGDGPVYAIEREFEDVVAVLACTDTPAHILAHSYGAVCSLEAARLTTRIDKMVLYEPPLPVPGKRLSFAADLASRLTVMLDRGDREGVVEAFLREVMGMGDEEIRRMQRSSSWRIRIDAAHTIPREVGVATSYQFRAMSFARVRVPTLFLVGANSPPGLRAGSAMASAAVAGSRIEILPGQGHAAMSTGPDIFLGKVLPFLGAT